MSAAARKLARSLLAVSAIAGAGGALVGFAHGLDAGSLSLALRGALSGFLGTAAVVVGVATLFSAAAYGSSSSGELASCTLQLAARARGLAESPARLAGGER